MLHCRTLHCRIVVRRMPHACGVLRRRIGAVASWLKTSGSRPHGFNASRRCVPDVSAYDAGCHFIKGGEGAVGVSLLCAFAPVSAGLCMCVRHACSRLHSHLGLGSMVLSGTAVIGTSCSAPIVAGMVLVAHIRTETAPYLFIFSDRVLRCDARYSTASRGRTAFRLPQLCAVAQGRRRLHAPSLS